MPKGSGGKSRVRGGSTKKQPRAKGKGSPGGKMTGKLMRPKQGPASGSSY